MTIPTRKQWTVLRDKAGGSSGLVKSVSVGKLLEDYEKATAGKMAIAAMLASTRQLDALAKGLKTYRAAIPKDKAKLAAVVDDIQKDVQGQIRDGEKLANPVNNVTSHMREVINKSAAIASSGDRTAYEKMWSVNVRGAGTGWAALAKLDPGLEPLRKAWLPVTEDGWGAPKLCAGLTDPAQEQAKIKTAAGKVNKMATQLMMELKKRKVIA